MFHVDDPRSEPRVLHELTQKVMTEDAKRDISICFVDENVASPQTLGFVCHAFIQMKAWQRTPKDVCREAKESLDCFVIATLWSNRHLCADRKADVNQPCQQSVFSPMGPCIRIWCTAVANVCLQAFSLFPLPFFRSTKGLFTDYNFTSRSGEWNLTQFWNITDEWYLFQISHTNHAIICLYY